jgi:RNA polymerase sigma-70 factor (ECF subfamily)
MLRATLLGMGASLSQQDREDLIQQVFTEFWRNRSSFRGECSVAHYLRRLAARTLSDHRRSEARRKQREAGTLTVWAEDDDHIQRHEAIELVHQALQHLPDAQRQAVELVCLQGRSIADASAIARCTTRSMRYRCGCDKALLEQHLRNLA